MFTDRVNEERIDKLEQEVARLKDACYVMYDPSPFYPYLSKKISVANLLYILLRKWKIKIEDTPAIPSETKLTRIK